MTVKKLNKRNKRNINKTKKQRGGSGRPPSNHSKSKVSNSPQIPRRGSHRRSGSPPTNSPGTHRRASRTHTHSGPTTKKEENNAIAKAIRMSMEPEPTKLPSMSSRTHSNNEEKEAIEEAMRRNSEDSEKKRLLNKFRYEQNIKKAMNESASMVPRAMFFLSPRQKEDRDFEEAMRRSMIQNIPISVQEQKRLEAVEIGRQKYEAKRREQEASNREFRNKALVKAGRAFSLSNIKQMMGKQ